MPPSEPGSCLIQKLKPDIDMKPTTKAALAGASVTAAVTLLLPVSLPEKAGAQETGAIPQTVEIKPVPAGAEEYRIFSLAQYQTDPDTRRVEETLNKMAAEGWRVKTGVGVALVLSR